MKILIGFCLGSIIVLGIKLRILEEELLVARKEVVEIRLQTNKVYREVFSKDQILQMHSVMEVALRTKEVAISTKKVAQGTKKALDNAVKVLRGVKCKKGRKRR